MSDIINVQDMVIEGFDPAILQLLTANLSNDITNEIVTNPASELANSFTSFVNTLSDTEITTADTIPIKKVSKKKAISKPSPIELPSVKVNEEVIEKVIGTNKVVDFIEESIFSEFKRENIKDLKLDLDEKVSIKFDEDTPIDIIVVGCGGNGSRIVNLLAQQMYSNKRIKTLYLYDDDRVEPKNLTRQLFYEFEVGEYKSKALADRYNMLYGLKVIPFTVKFALNTNKTPVSSNHLVVFDCVDNKQGRESVEELIKIYSSNTHLNVQNRSSYNIEHHKSLTVISCGNQKDHGQVHVGHVSKYEKSLYNRMFNYVRVPSCVNFIEDIKRTRYRDILMSTKCVCSLLTNENSKNSITYLSPFLEYNKTFEDSKESVSCADMEIAEEQSMAINATIAQLAFNMFFEMLVNKDGLKNNIVFANLSNDFSVQRCNTKESIIDYYIKSIFGKNVFFEKEACLDQVYRSLSVALNAINNIDSMLKINAFFYDNTLKNDKIVCFLESGSRQQKSIHQPEYQVEFHSLIKEYKEEISNSINKFIEENYSKDKENSYMENELLISFIISYLQLYFAYIYEYMYNTQYNTSYYLGNKLRELLFELSSELINSFISTYEEISSKSNYQYFIKG